MSIKKVHIIAIQEEFLDSISKQVKEVLGDKITIQSTSLKDLQTSTVKAGEIVILSNEIIKGLVTQLIPKDTICVIATRDINIANTKELLDLPPGQTILVVNDTQTNTDDTIKSLQETIFEHKYIAYSPDEMIPDSIDYFITPGEKHLLPSSLPNVIDIGSRLLDIDTFSRLLTQLEIEEYYPTMTKRYFKSLVSQSILEQKNDRTRKINISKDIRDIAQYHFNDFVAVSSSMRETIKNAKKLATTANSILIQGESGTGKNMLAQAIHNGSLNNDGPFVSINCSSRDFDIIERELFGCENGDLISLGLLELAKNGTLCIEEVNELPLHLQYKLVSVLQEQLFYRVEGKAPILLKARIITTSTKNMKELVDHGTFNEELYRSLSMFSLRVPQLCERKEDFFPLIEDIKSRLKRRDLTFTEEVMDAFLQYPWVGNVKELYNVITYLSSLDEPMITFQALPLYLRSSEKNVGLNSLVHSKIDPDEIIKKIEEHGFLEESVEILLIYKEGKKDRESFGRLTLKKRLEEKKITLSEQQLRMRIEVLQSLGLLIVRQGRAGSTISSAGEEFLQYIHLKQASSQSS